MNKQFKALIKFETPESNTDEALAEIGWRCNKNGSLVSPTDPTHPSQEKAEQPAFLRKILD